VIRSSSLNICKQNQCFLKEFCYKVNKFSETLNEVMNATYQIFGLWPLIKYLYLDLFVFSLQYVGINLKLVQ